MHSLLSDSAVLPLSHRHVSMFVVHSMEEVVIPFPANDFGLSGSFDPYDPRTSPAFREDQKAQARKRLAIRSGSSIDEIFKAQFDDLLESIKVKQ